LFIFVHSMNLGNVMRPLMAPRLSLQLYPSFTIIFGTNHGLLGKINACPTFVPILSHVPKMFQKCSKIPDSSTLVFRDTFAGRIRGGIRTIRCETGNSTAQATAENIYHKLYWENINLNTEEEKTRRAAH